MCFVGVQEVARELEQPFRNAPNDLPLTTFQAQFNEALIAMYAGFHPDAWSVEEQVTVRDPDTSLTSENAADETTQDTVNEERKRKASIDTMDLLSFFRMERAEADKSNKGEEKPTMSPMASPKAILKKASAPFLAGGAQAHDNEKDESTSSLVIVGEPKSILKKADESTLGKGEDEEKKDGVV